MSAQRNNLSFFVRSALFGNLIPDTLPDEERQQKTIMVFRGVVNGPKDERGWCSAMPVLGAASMFRQGSPKIFETPDSAVFKASVKATLHRKAVQQLLHHPAHEALVRLIVAKAIVQQENPKIKTPKFSSPFLTKSKDDFENVLSGAADYKTKCPALLSRSNGYTKDDIKFFSELRDQIQEEERPNLKQFKRFLLFDFPNSAHILSTKSKRTVSETESPTQQANPKKSLIRIIDYSEIEEVNLLDKDTSQSIIGI